jgi:hypothetical protein
MTSCARSGGMTSASLRTPAGSSEPMTGATSAVRTPPHHSAGKGPAKEDNEDNEDNDYAPGFHVHHHHRDEIGMSQLGGAPLCTQGDKQILTKLHFLIPSVYELTMLKIVTNLVCLILAGSQ